MVKIERSFPAPASLAVEVKKVNGKYDRQDVIEQLRKDFHDKCYICEMKELQDPNVEHLLPHKNGKYPGRKFDWENLFWSCGHCNGTKNSSKYDAQNKRMNEYDGISATKIVQIYKHTFFKILLTG